MAPEFAVAGGDALSLEATSMQTELSPDHDPQARNDAESSGFQPAKTHRIAAPPALGIAVTATPRGQHLTVIGELDLATAAMLAEAVRVGLDAGTVEVDLCGVSFMDSSGLKVLIVASRQLEDPTRLVVVDASPQAERVLRLADVAEMLGLDPERTGPAPTPAGPRTQLIQLLADVVGAIAGCDSASVTVVDGPQTYTAAAFDAVAFALDGAQYTEDSGPCLSAARSGKEIVLPRIVGGSGRYEGFRDAASVAGIKSCSSTPFRTTGRERGALTLYSSTEGCFSEDGVEQAQAFADEIGALLSDPV